MLDPWERARIWESEHPEYVEGVVLGALIRGKVDVNRSPGIPEGAFRDLGNRLLYSCLRDARGDVDRTLELLRAQTLIPPWALVVAATLAVETMESWGRSGGFREIGTLVAQRVTP